MRLLVIFLFHESKPSGPLINILKWFCLKFRFREDIREIIDSAQANTAQSRTPRRLTLRGVGLRAVLACEEFCREQFCLCRPLLALIKKTKNVKNICELLQHGTTFF